MPEPMMNLLRDLPGAEPDPARAERTRLRCRSRLAARPRVSTSSAPSVRGSSGSKALLWQPVVAVLGVAYLAEALVQALRAYGIP